jgi:hypothetical protein
LEFKEVFSSWWRNFEATPKTETELKNYQRWKKYGSRAYKTRAVKSLLYAPKVRRLENAMWFEKIEDF